MSAPLGGGIERQARRMVDGLCCECLGQFERREVEAVVNDSVGEARRNGQGARLRAVAGVAALFQGKSHADDYVVTVWAGPGEQTTGNRDKLDVEGRIAYREYELAGKSCAHISILGVPAKAHTLNRAAARPPGDPR